MKCFVLILLCLTTVFAAPQSAAQKTIIRQIVQELGYTENLQAGLILMIEKTRKENPDIPEETWGSLRVLLEPKDITEQFVMSWAGVYTEKELRELLEFFRTPVGKKFAAKHQLVVDAMANVGAGMGLLFYQTLHKKHPDRFPMDQLTRQLQNNVENNRGKNR